MTTEDTDATMLPDDVLRRFVLAEASAPEDTEGQDEARARLAAALGFALASAAAPEIAASVATKTLAKSTAWSAFAKGVLLLGIGFGAGFGVRATLTPQNAASHEPPIASASPSTAPVVMETARSDAPDTVDIANLPMVTSAAPTLSLPVAKPTAPVAAGDAEAERLLLETARVALRRGDREGALRLLQEHRTRFPHGQLREERDGLNVSALSLLGRTEEASKAAARFHKDYPLSLQNVAVPLAVDAGP